MDFGNANSSLCFCLQKCFAVPFLLPCFVKPEAYRLNLKKENAIFAKTNNFEA